MSDDPLPFFSRFAFAFAAFFRIFFDGAFAARLWRARELSPSPTPQAAPPTPEVDLSELESRGALLLLALLQREGRLIDFLEQDIASFSDADVGAAARAVHEGARRALRAHMSIIPARTEAEGSSITLETGFDAAAVKLTGNVRGAPPHSGTLKHPGWRAKDLHLPQATKGHDVHVLAPAEVEL